MQKKKKKNKEWKKKPHDEVRKWKNAQVFVIHFFFAVRIYVKMRHLQALTE